MRIISEKYLSSFKSSLLLHKSFHQNSSFSTYKHRILEQLTNRSLLRINGPEAPELLQGLITNDVKLFNSGAKNIYTFFLNIRGRILYDTIIYKNPEKDSSFYIECDSQILNQLEKHLIMYRLRRKVEIQSLHEKTKVWTLFNPNDLLTLEKFGKFCCINSNNLNNNITSSNQSIDEKLLIYQDPRLSNLGLRIITDIGIERGEISEYLEESKINNDRRIEYKELRYRLGIGEGIEDIPPGKSLPLEVNGDYLNGISFEKGCYIGQELTARTHHIGVVRKRLMPIIFENHSEYDFKYDDVITNESGKAVGKFRGKKNEFGLGLMRISEALASPSLYICRSKVSIVKPFWWLQEKQEREFIN